MEKYIKAELEIIEIHNEDIVTTSIIDPELPDFPIHG